jgi:hypothetical protein
MCSYYFGGKIQVGILLSDVCMILYWLYLAFGTARRIGAIVLSRGSCGAKLRALLSWWRFLDLAVVASLLTCIVTWGLLAKTCADSRATVASAGGFEVLSVGPGSVQVRACRTVVLLIKFQRFSLFCCYCSLPSTWQ